MLKRIKERFATTYDDIDKLNEEGYMPTQDEIDNPDKSWEEIAELKRLYQFEGDYHCKLCPNKIIYNK
jgi:hypothetical protein